MDSLLTELHSRWDTIFRSLADGDDVPPALRLRAEGLMEAAVLAGFAEPGDIQVAMAERYLAVYGNTVAAEFGENWPELFPFPQIPAIARRAPVFPSTRD